MIEGFIRQCIHFMWVKYGLIMFLSEVYIWIWSVKRIRKGREG